MCKYSCIKCHFFIKTRYSPNSNNEHVLYISEKERNSIQSNEFSWKKDDSSLSCYFGVWDEGVGLHDDLYGLLIKTDRRNYCFYREYKPGMLLPAAKILQEREDEYRKTNKNRKLTMIGLWIAGIGLLINAVLGIINLINFIT